MYRDVTLMSSNAILDFFLRDQLLEDVTWAIGSELEAYTYTQLPVSHPQRELLYPAYLAQVARHQIIKSELYELLERWYKAGFTIMLYKGFYLSEWVYPKSGQRSYIDIDIVVNEAQWEAMAFIAEEQGWELSYRDDDDLRSQHEIAHLYSPQLHFKIDVHRSLVNQLGGTNDHTDINQKVWDSAKKLQWQNLEVYVLTPEDCVLLGLVLHRMWSLHGRINLRDYIDFRMLHQRFSLSEKSLLIRAKELGIERTTEYFLQRCNPIKKSYLAAVPSAKDSKERQRLLAGETGPKEQRLLNLRLYVGLKRLLGFLRFMPVTLYTWFLNLCSSDIEQFFERLNPKISPLNVSMDTISKDINGSVRLICKLIQKKSTNVLFASTLFAIYRRLGQPVVFVLGRDVQGKKHAWLELAGMVISDPKDRFARRTYTVEFQFPSEPQT